MSVRPIYERRTRRTSARLEVCCLIAGAWLTGVSAAGASTAHPAIPDGVLSGVDAQAADDAWAVGSTFTERSMAEHWNGSGWSETTVPKAPHAIGASLYGVTDLSPSDAWAVGYSDLGGGDGRSLVVHWTGSSWQVVHSPNQPQYAFTGLNAVASAGPADVWAVGYADRGVSIPVIEHWDGAHWTLVSAPLPPTQLSGLRGVAVISASDVWAVGDQERSSEQGKSLIEHWDGSAWSIVPSANPPGARLVTLESVSGTSPDDVWATGRSDNGSVIEHWDGHDWTVVPGGSGAAIQDLASVSARNDHDAWAVGFTFDGSERSLIEHWDGQTWATVAGAHRLAGDETPLEAVSTGPGSSAWTAGVDETTDKALTEHWNGRVWQVR